METSITVIIVTYNSEKYIKKCLISLTKNFPRVKELEVLVIDNNSSDMTCPMVERICTNDNRITLIQNNKNLGFAKAVNQGIKLSNKKHHVLLLNPDTIIKKNSLSNLLSEFNLKNADICGGRMVNDKNIEHGSYVRFPSLGILLFDFTNLRKLSFDDKWHKNFYYSDQNFTQTIPVNAVSGGYMLIHRKVLKNVGLFDEGFFMYLEDIDYCLRAFELGYSTYYCPTATIVHIGGASSKNRIRIDLKAWRNSRDYYVKKHVKSHINKTILLSVYYIDNLLIDLWRIFKK